MVLVRLPWPKEQRALLQDCWRRKQLCIPTERNPGTETIEVQRNIGLPGTARASKLIPRLPRCSKHSLKSYSEATRNLSVLYSLCKCRILLVSSCEGNLLSEPKVYLASLPRNVYPEVWTSWRHWLAFGYDSSGQQ